ncbi:MAG: HlyD family secretion protein [Proteobacteria bacterium]|nr:HlyD family secretion protein [Pseudomonadota bacterium]MBS0573729.1 HlyD family secretion protein [Pseudomonadota bacterium]
MSNADVAAPGDVVPEAVGQGRTLNRRRVLMIAGPIVLLLVAGLWWILGGRYESTDNAYVHLARVQIAADVGGQVVKVMAGDNQAVKAGDTLFEVDPVPYRLALAKADAAVAAARLGVAQMKAAYRQALAQQEIAETDAVYYASESRRQEGLEAKGAVTGTQASDARHAEQAANDRLDLARSNVALALAALGGNADVAVDSHPSAQAALVARNQAAYELSKTRVVAPKDGIVYQAEGFRAGQIVAVGQPLFSFVETGDVWVDANFKETQLTHIRVGQPAEVTLDADPSTPLKAVVDAIGAGTGAEFSLLPAQNATGNWVKVTQRVPVRLRLVQPFDRAGGQTLASGLSAEVSVDTGYRRSLSDLLPAGWRQH